MKKGIIGCLICWIFLDIPIIFAQLPWSGKYGNEWLTGKYSQTWARIGVNQKGIYKISLPANFQNKSGQLHLYHRGVEVSLISATSTEIEFYGVPNDGESDALLYRPYTGLRPNPYYSWFSDEGAYFLTTSSESATKLAAKHDLIAIAGQPELYHLQTDLRIYTDEYTHDEGKNIQYFPLEQSYYDNSKGMSSKVYWKRTNLSDNTSKGDPKFLLPFKLKNLVVDDSRKPVIDVMFNGRTFTNNQIRASIGGTLGTLRDYSSLIEFSNFIPYNKKLTIEESTDLGIADNFGERIGNLQLESVKITDLTSTTGAFSVNYVRFLYPQSFDMEGVTSKTFNLLPSNNLTSRVTISNFPQGAKIYDVTDSENPILISGTITGNLLDVMVKRITGKELNLLVSGEVMNLTSEGVKPISFTKYDPDGSDYLIVSNETLFTAAEKYANYRRSGAGGSYRAVTVKVKDLYNQFNYGEPSPIAIRRFVDYMIQNTARDKHNLLLIGPSTTFPARAKRELSDEVPSIGYPGSDILLVEGLINNHKDIPSIPVGRISATTVKQVENYLNKVKYFESTSTFDWKKRVVHLNGGKSPSEIVQFKSTLEDLSPLIKNGFLGGEVLQFVKKSTVEVESVDISAAVNEGAGLISYLGHGSPSVTDLDYGYASDLSRGYTNFGKYPLLYFNGCGVGNIFSGRHNPSPTASDRIPISSDWLLAEEKGSIAVIANSYYSFASSSSRYLNLLYNLMFGSDASNSLSIGQIQKIAAEKIHNSGFTDYDVANIHQSLLQGDPAIKLFPVELPDYSSDRENSIYLKSESPSKTIGESKTISSFFIASNKGRFVPEQKIPIRFVYYFKNGSSVVKDTVINAVAFRDTVVSTISVRQPVSRVSAEIDPTRTIKEQLTDNNKSELVVDWEIAKDEISYPSGVLSDMIAPIIEVTLDGSPLKNNVHLPSDASLKITLTDDRMISSDTTLLDVYIKPCSSNDCDFKRISHSSNSVKLISFSSYSVSLSLDVNVLKAESGELMVIGKDRSGNKTSQPYKLSFNIGSKISPPLLSVWPNPSSEYVCFDINNFPTDFTSGKVTIFNLQGLVVEEVILSKLSRWFWFPKVSNGVYFYKLLLEAGHSSHSYRGKVVIVR